MYLGYYASSEADNGRAIDIDDNGNAFISGWTRSEDFPRTAGVPHRGSSDAFAAKLSPEGTFVFSTLLGGLSTNLAYGQDIDSTGNIYIIGSSLSSDFPSTEGRAYQGGMDVMIAKINSRLFPWTMFLPAFSRPQQH